eukprot:COSAG02_NODE_1653_length_11488_cov_66.480815_3_plen_103_part_00
MNQFHVTSVLTAELNEYEHDWLSMVLTASSRFRGIRVLGYDFKTIASDPRFAEAMALLERYNLTFDVGGETDALEDVVLLAKTYPKVCVAKYSSACVCAVSV